MNISKYLTEYRKELEFKNYSKSSIELYTSVVYNFLHDFENSFSSPIKINTEIIKEWIKQAKSISVMKIRIGALKNFYQRVIKQPLKFEYIEYPRKEYKSPIILDLSEIQSLFDNCGNEKHRTILFVLYATGIRVSELLSIKLKDIDRANMVIHIMKGKGNKQRSVTMKIELLKILESYYRAYKPNEFLFEGQNGDKYTASSIRQFINLYANKAGIKKKVYPHLIRHSSFTHSLEAGENLYTIQKIAGHNNPSTTAIYLHMSPKIVANAFSPIQNINI